MSAPYFSILLPTKNRSQLVGLAVRSVLQQDFRDFELIICDNDDDPFATRDVLQEYLEEPRVKYIRTGGLSMIDNWNAALAASTGQNITILEDKMIFYPDSLSKLFAKIDESPNGVVVWGFDCIEDDHSPPRLKRSTVMEECIWKTNEVLTCLTKDIMNHWAILPRGLASVLPTKLINEIGAKFGGRFYQPLSPDFISALKVLSTIDEYLVTSDVYTLVISNKVGNGRSLYLRKEKDHSYWQGHDQLIFNLDLVPVKSAMILTNTLVIDYRSMTQEHKGKLENFPIAHRNYIQMMMLELIRSTISARRIVWSSSEVKQLLFSEGRLIKNVFHIVCFSLSLIFSKINRKLSDMSPKQDVMVSELDKDSARTVDQFLRGQISIGDVKPFPVDVKQAPT